MTKFPNYNGIIFEPNFLKYSYKNKISEKPFFLAKKKKPFVFIVSPMSGKPSPWEWPVKMEGFQVQVEFNRVVVEIISYLQP